jgi:hypothetical protein
VTNAAKSIWSWVTDTAHSIWDWIFSPGSDTKSIWDWITTPVVNLLDLLMGKGGGSGGGGGGGGGGSSGAGSASSGGMQSNIYPSTWNVPKVSNPFASDFVWRPGQAPQRFSSGDTVVGTKGGSGDKGITVNLGGITIQRVSSDIDVKRIGEQVTDIVISKLRTMS